MKKIIIIGILFVLINLLFALKDSTDNVFIEKIDLNLAEGEVGLTFLNYENSNYILVSTTLSKTLIVLNEDKNDEVLKTLSKFSALDLDNVLTIKQSELFNNSKEINKEIVEEIYIEKKDNTIELNYGEKKLSIYLDESPKEITGNFIYLVGLSAEYAEIDENVEIIFYDEKTQLNDNLKTEIYSKWIDLYNIKNKEWTTLKLSKDDYKMITIPNKE